MLVRRQCCELRHHGSGHRHAARHGAGRHDMRLRGSREIDEDRDEDQQRIAEQAEEAERRTRPIARSWRRFRSRAHNRAAIASSARNTRPPSIGKAGIKLNSARNMLTNASRSIMLTLGALERAKGDRRTDRAADEHQQERDDDVDRRARDGNQKFFARLVRGCAPAAPRRRSAAKSRRVSHAETPRREDMAELVQRHAEEQQQDEQKAVPRRLRSR